LTRLVAALDPFQSVVSVAFPLHERFAVISLRLRFLIVAVISSLTIGSLFAQEAVETAKPGPDSPEQSPKPKSKNPDQSKPTRSLEETMRPEEFKAAGLDKLNEDELQHLDAYLQGYRQAAKKKAADEAQAKASEEVKKAKEQAKAEAKADADTGMGGRSRMDSLVSRVDGNIDGIKGHTMIRLEDGTVWKQVNVDDHYKASVTDHPVAVVLHTTFGYKMRIEGMPEFYVDPVNSPGR
jgi:hypothetical protein